MAGVGDLQLMPAFNADRRAVDEAADAAGEEMRARSRASARANEGQKQERQA